MNIEKINNLVELFFVNYQKQNKNNIFLTSLKDQTLRKLEFTDLKNIKENIIFSDLIGRIRDIDVHPTNGKIFLLSSNKLWIMQK